MAAEKPELSRGELLKKLRAEHAQTVERTQELLKDQKRIQRDICSFIRETPKSVPEIAKEIGLPANQVLWYIASFRKYGIVVEDGMCEDYPLYRKAEEN
ncbi:MAG: winged helix-turn-helix domain-containing protein [Anaerolineales bacterium]|nr:winged helix-turn-helix domain-containing protein [Anaerolineales bacterium]